MKEVSRLNGHITRFQTQVVDTLERLCSLEPESRSSLILQDERRWPPIVARAIKESMFAVFNQTSYFREDGSVSDATREQYLASVVPETVTKWWEQQSASTEYIPTSEGPAAREIMRKAGELPDALDVYLDRVNATYGMRGHEVYERVRTGEYVTLNRKTYPLYRDRLRSLYQDTLLRSESIEKLASNDTRMIKEYQNETRKGVFIYDIDEPINGGLSVGEQMDRDFRREYGPRDSAYVGKALVDDQGNLLSYLTYWQTPRRPKKKDRKHIRNYLYKGVTGGKMQYKGGDPEHFLKTWDKILMFDTVCADRDVPMGSARLIAKAAQDMLHENPELQVFIAYRLHQLSMEPTFPALSQPINMSENKSSRKFFDLRGCSVFADDFNEHGPKSRRIVNGTEVMLNPWWVAFNADMRTFLMESWGLVRATQYRYGDTTEDDLNIVTTVDPVTKESVRMHANVVDEEELPIFVNHHMRR